MKTTPLFVASDHAGYELKVKLIESQKEISWNDLGPFTTDSVDYPDYAEKLAESLKKNPNAMGLLICGSGQGMNIKANRYKHIRAALCGSEEIAKLSRQHNDANVLCLGARFTDLPTATLILKTFLQTEFEGGRHARRVAKLSQDCGS